MKYISRNQLAEALRLLFSFRAKVHSQRVQHILPFLALRKMDVGTLAMTPYAESDDFNFFDEYARVGDTDFPYFDPIAGIFRIRTHPHSNIATARKGTFYRSWHAGRSDVDAEGRETWQLEADYLEIIEKKALTKATKLTKVPAIPLGAFLFRNRAFPDDATPIALGQSLKAEFSLTEEEYSRLFEETTQIPNFESNAPMSPSDILGAIKDSGVVARDVEAQAGFQNLIIKDDDEILIRVKALLEDGYAGVIFVGPPGTSKSWYAVQIALALVDGDSGRLRKIQFHKSFQYEDFVQGFVPNPEGTGFELREQIMLRLISDAENDLANTYVVLIDELSRSDPGRVFGELLTYMEPSRRGEQFLLASGDTISVPPNIIFLGTMNSRDKSVFDIDDAFDRRVAKIEFPPKEPILTTFLNEQNVDADLARRIVGFFKWVQPKYPLGHTFFRPVKDIQSLQRLWETQLRFVFEKAFKYEPAVQDEIQSRFSEITGINLA
jgi:5-methylcytosine-specific restriction enzyme B